MDKIIKILSITILLLGFISLFVVEFLFENKVLASDIFPLKISSTGKYLEDKNSNPFLIVGDAGWSMVVQLSQEDIVRYLDDRLAKGFNAVEIEVIDHKFQTNAPNNFYNEPPFTNGHADWSLRNEAYWTRIDYALTQMKNRGMVVLLFPAYLGWACGSEGWCADMVAQTNEVMNDYGQWLGNRYKDYGNVIWMTGGDTDASLYANALARNNAIVSGIRSADPDAIFSVLPLNGQIGGIDSYLNLVDINAVYSYGKPQSMVQRAYNNSKPFIFAEGYYENEHSTTLVNQEAQALITYLGGGLVGHIFGSCPLWSFGVQSQYCNSKLVPFDTWQNNLNSPASIAAGAVGKLMQSRKWWALVPDYSNAVVISAKGSEMSYHATAREASGKTVMVWCPNINQVTVDMTKISGSEVKARWFNPDDGSSLLISTYPATGTMNFTPPSARKVLVLDDASLNLSAPGTTTYTESVIQDIIIPTTPTNLLATAISSSQINLTWTASTDNIGVTGYRIYRGGTQIATTATNSYSNTGLSASTLYSYTVQAYDAAGNSSSQSSSASVTTQVIIDIVPPATPIGVMVN